MFACIHGRSVSESKSESSTIASALVELAFTFSPLVEQASADTVVLDVAGQDLLFGESLTTAGRDDSNNNVAREILRRAKQINLKVDVSIAANPDAAIHTARCFKGMTIIDSGQERRHLAPLSLKKLDCSLAGIQSDEAEEIHETFALWGIRTFGDLARLPLSGVAERLGQKGVRLQNLAQGKSDRHLDLVRPPIGFEQSLELEHPVTEFEPLAFVLSRLLNQLCANLHEYGLATNELKMRFVTERCSEYRLQSGISAADKNPTEVGTLNACDQEERTLTLPVAMRAPKTLLRLLLFNIEARPPTAPIIAVTIVAEPVKPRAAQTGLFIPLAPEPERLEITLARLVKLVGADNVGSPEILNTHRPDAFRMKQFHINQKLQRRSKNDSRFALNADKIPALPVMGFRRFRPSWRADVQTIRGRPMRISARADSSRKVSGKIVCASGPWRMSGEWWRTDVWARDEWDVAVIDQASPGDQVLCRIYRDLSSERWFLAGIYD